MSTDVDTLARTLYGEAKARDELDAAAIAAVVMNRVAYPNWPSTVAAVCMQPWQFSCWNQSDPNRQRILNAKVTDLWFRKCQEIAEKTIAGHLGDHIGKATHYYARSMKRPPKWAKGKTPSHQTAGHLFFNDIDTPAPKTAREALDQTRPLGATRTVKGGQVASVGTAGTAVSQALDSVNQAKDGIGGLMLYVEELKWVFIGLTVLGIGITLYARWKDRESGAR